MLPPLESDAEYLLLRFAGPGRPVRNVGILLYDPRANRLCWRVRIDRQNIADADDAEILAELSRYLQEQVERMGADEFLRGLEDTLSNVLLLSERRTVQVADLQEAADALYELHVVQAATCEKGQR
jgi:hypothetical protein